MATIAAADTTAPAQETFGKSAPPRKPSPSQIAAARGSEQRDAVWPSFTAKLPASLYIDQDRFDEELTSCS